MKKLIATSIVLLSCYAASFANLSNKNKLVYDRTVNPIIGITVDNIHNNTTYVIKDKNGNVVKKGNTNAGKTISLQTSSFRSGAYVFEINGDSHEFVIE